jgi:uncharacterized protein (DUF305 family)
MAWMDDGMDGADGTDYEPHDGSLMPGMATNTQIDELRAAEGREAEVLYLQLMTEHHRAGVDMAEGATELAEDPVVIRLAEGMIRGQQSEMELMAGMLEDRGASLPQDDGGEDGHHH